MDVFSLYSYGKRCTSKWLILCIIFSCADTEIYFRRLLPKRKIISQMNHTAMNNSIWTTNSQSLSDFEFSHFCRYFPFLFDSCGHILLIICGGWFGHICCMDQKRFPKALLEIMESCEAAKGKMLHLMEGHSVQDTKQTRIDPGLASMAANRAECQDMLALLVF